MSFDVIYSDWLISSFDNVVATKEWNVFVTDLHDAVEHQLTENNIDNFHSLLDHEKSIIIQKAQQSLSGSLCYQIINEKISEVLDLKINHESERIIRLNVNPFQTRTETILTATFEGIISILGRWPDLRNKLWKMFNLNLPDHLRHHIWRAVLDNPSVLDTYQKDMRSKSKSIISKYDKEISQTCEKFLNNEPYLIEMKGSVGCFYGMKAVLSYYQAINMSDRRLQKSDYCVIIPLIYVLCRKLSTREPPIIKVMEILVQEYFSLRQILHIEMPYIDSIDNVSEDQYRYFCQQVYRNIVTIDVGSAQSMMDHLVPAQDNIVATEVKLFDLAGEVIEKLLRPLITSLFVGFVSMETLLFIWDQFLLGFDKPTFREKYWPMITGIYLELIIRRRINNQNKSVKINLDENLLKNEGMKLKPFDFQYQINKSFYVELMRVIPSFNVVGVDPIAEPTKWKHWFDSIHHISPISPQDRNDMRALREKEREKFAALEEKLKLMEEEKLRLEKKLELQANIYISNYETASTKYKNAHLILKTELNTLRDQNMETNRAMESLREEYQKLKDIKLRRTNEENYRGLVPPPVTPKSQFSPRLRSAESYENNFSDPNSSFTQEFITKMGHTFQIILNGDGKEKFDLNDETIKFINLYEEDKKEIEMELFNRHLSHNELESLDAANDGYYSQKIYQEIAKRIDDRRQKSQPSNPSTQTF